MPLGAQERMLDATAPVITGGSGDYTLSNEFTPIADGIVTHLRYWHVAGHPAGGHIHPLSLWRVSDSTKVASVLDAPPDTTGFREVALATPYAVTAGVVYRVSYAQLTHHYTGAAPPASLAPHLVGSASGYYGSGSDTFPGNAQAGVNRHADVVYQEGVDDAGGDLPLSTESVQAKNYQDLNTGCVYELDLATNEYNLVYCPPTVGDGGAGGGVLVGNYTWDTARGAPASGGASLDANPVVGVPNVLYLSETDADGNDRSAYLAAVAEGDIVWLDDGAGGLMKVVVDGTPTDEGTYWAISFTPLSTDEPADGASVVISLVPQTAGGGGVVIPPPPLQVTGLVMTPQADVMEDGSLRPSILAEWDALDPDDLSRYDLEVARGIDDRATAWTLEVVAGTATLPPGDYVVSVSITTDDGGWTIPFQRQATIAAGEQLWVKNLDDCVTPGFQPFFQIYVGTITVLPLKAADIGAADYQITAVPTGTDPEPTNSTAILWERALSFATYLNRFVVTDLQPNTHVVGRVKGVDSYAQSGAWSDEVSATTVADTEAPAQPTNFSASGGYKLFGASWKQAPTPDLAFFQLRYRLVGETLWEYRRALATIILVNGLETPAEYEVSVRAIDRSGNVEVSPGPPQVVANWEDDLDAGWVDEVTVTLSTIPAEGIAYEELFANYAHLINIDASQIVSGSLEMWEDVDSLGNISIYAANEQLTGYWSPDGWYIIDPFDPSHAIRGKDGTISFTAEGSDPIWTTPEALWGTAIGWWGINADFITTGSLDGGHNRLLNSGFEVLPTGVIISVPKVWTTTADFDGTIGTVINTDGSGNALVLVNYAP